MIVTLSTPAGGLPVPFVGGLVAADVAADGMTRTLASALGPAGVGVLCIRPETDTSKQVWELHGQALGIALSQFHRLVAARAVARPLSTRAEIAEVAALLASDRASAVTATVANRSLGQVVG